MCTPRLTCANGCSTLSVETVFAINRSHRRRRDPPEWRWEGCLCFAGASCGLYCPAVAAVGRARIAIHGGRSPNTWRRSLRRNSWLSVLPVVLIGVLWGLNWPAIKFLLSELPPLTVRAIAFPLAAILLALIARAKGQSLRPAADDVVPIALTGLLVVFGFNVLTTFGQVLTQTSNAAIIAYTMPALTALLAGVFLKEQLGPRIWLALVVGMTGLAVLATEDLRGLVDRPGGPIIMLFAALSWASGNVALKARQWSIEPLPLTVWFFVVSSVFCWPLVLAFEPPSQLTWPKPSVVLVMAYHVLGPMVICYAVWTAMVERLPATVAAISTLLAPVVGVCSAVALLGDTLSWQKVIALLLVLTSIAFTFWAPKDIQ